MYVVCVVLFAIGATALPSSLPDKSSPLIARASQSSQSPATTTLVPTDATSGLRGVASPKSKSFVEKIWDLLPLASHHSPHDKHHEEAHAMKDYDFGHHWGRWKGK